jgi:hypothetical protein
MIFVAGESQSGRTKYAFGAEIEYALSDHWFARAEFNLPILGVSVSSSPTV